MHVHVFPIEMALNDRKLFSAELAQQLLLLQLLHLLVVLPQRLLHRRLGVVSLAAFALQLQSGKKVLSRKFNKYLMGSSGISRSRSF